MKTIQMGNPDHVIIVHLRRPRRNESTEQRSDPFWEFGSFGCTGCHRKNLMNPSKINELEGARLAFVQGGDLGMKLLLVTPPVRVTRHKAVCELLWKPPEMPFTYECAPLIVDGNDNSDFPKLRSMIRRARRSTGPARFSSCFRTRRTPLEQPIAAELLSVYGKKRLAASQSQIAHSYEQALPYLPNTVDQNRKKTYDALRKEKGSAKRCCSKKRRC